jgi:hypothetical protein
MHKLYLQVTLPHIEYPEDTPDDEKSYWTNRIGFNIIKKIKLLINGNEFDILSGLYMHIWSELTHSIDKKQLLDHLVGSKGEDGISKGLCCDKPHTLNIPIFFTCHEYIQNSIPLISLKDRITMIKIEFNSLDNCIQKGILPNNKLYNVNLWVDYIFLDSEERRLICLNNNDYLYNYINSSDNSMILNKSIFKLPVSQHVQELLWVLRKKKPQGDKFTDFTIDHKISNIKDIQLYINKKEIFSSGAKKNKYFNYYLPYKKHTGKPDLGINCYPFSINPEVINPTGHLTFNISDGSIKITKNTNDECDVFLFTRIIEPLHINTNYISTRTFHR